MLVNDTHGTYRVGDIIRNTETGEALNVTSTPTGELRLNVNADGRTKGWEMREPGGDWKPYVPQG
jgi:hypothetical protein